MKRAITIIILSIISISLGLLFYQENVKLFNEKIKNKNLKVEKIFYKKKEENLTSLWAEANKELALIYTFKTTGIDTSKLSDIKKIVQLAQNLPIGSPFKASYLVTSFFGPRDERKFGGDNQHGGIDIIRADFAEHPAVYTTASGTITDFGVSKIFGKYILFTTDHGYQVKYAHLNKIFYQKGRKVKGVHLSKWTKIGLMGNTGESFGYHLHYEIHYLNPATGNYIKLDPDEILKFIRKEN